MIYSDPLESDDTELQICGLHPLSVEQVVTPENLLAFI